MPKSTPDFVSMDALRGGHGDPVRALAAIRRIYFRTTQKTIEADLAAAIELLMSLPDEATREKATVYMEGLAQMRKEWRRSSARAPRRTRTPRR
ncbi:MAG: hypothetical protein FJW23_02470 [Acidimicrobiia bacterium]|nr:hypothetical protein [Acidimicrobiia bacterium]